MIQLITRTINLMSIHTYAALINASYGHVIVTCPVEDSISSQSITTRPTAWTQIWRVSCQKQSS